METLPGPKLGQKLHRDTAPKSFYRQEFADNRARQRGFDGSYGYKRRRVGPGLGFSQSTGGLQRNNSWFRRHFPLAAILPSPMRSMRDWLDTRRQQIKPPAAQNWASQAEESYNFQVALALRLTAAASRMDDLHGFQIHNCCSTPLFSFRNTLKQRHIASGSVSKVNDEWFANEEKVRAEVGLLEKPVVVVRQYEKELLCGICFDFFPRSRMKAAACGHHFCNACWIGYIHTSVNDGPGCLTLRCPDPSCSAAVGEDMVLSLVSDEDRTKYTRYLLRSYVEDNRKTKWCPAPGCEYGVDFVMGSGPYDVSCKCTHNFCWNCCEEAHRPVDCETVEKWILKNSAESENMNWILANSKPCPKCKRPIEKNQGCMHITCTPPCKFEFCWLCLGAWSEHGERTGGFYACNRYETAKQEGVYDESERRREMAKNSLERYTHYYERWATNESSRAKALLDLQQMQAVQIEKLSDRQCQPVSQLKFVTEAWLQIVECRRVLKWTYAYGYYLPEHEHAKRQFFEYLQGEAESGLERLHQCAEKELQGYIDVDSPAKDFNDFRTKLAGLTSVTRNYFENLVQALENGLSDVNNGQAGVKGSSSKASGSNKGRGRSKFVTSKISSSRNTDDNRH